MAIALAIIGFLVGGLLKPMSLAMDYQKIKYTDITLEQIKEALVSFAIINKRLPCPAKCSKYSGKSSDCVDGVVYNANYVGKEDKNDYIVDIADIYSPDIQFCGIQTGYLPWVDLGIGRYDGWDEPFHYKVDKYYSILNILTKINDKGIINSFKTDDSERLKVRDTNNKNYTTTEQPLGHSRIIAIILSSGKNGDLETGNTGSDATYAWDDYIENGFDDRVTWLSKYTLINRLLITHNLYNNTL